MPDDGVQVQVVGLDEFIAGAEGLADKISVSAGPAMEKGARRAASQARGAVPRLTGRLAGSITTSSTEGKAVLSMGEGLPYAGWIEYGGTRGRPYVEEGRYLYPAAQAAEGVVVEAAAAQAEHEIGGYPWKTPRP